MKEAFDLMQTLHDGIAVDQVLADELARIAETTEADGDPATAAALRAVVRNHRIRALEMGGQLAALCARYGNHNAAS